jgi:hypothetical protein
LLYRTLVTNAFYDDVSLLGRKPVWQTHRGNFDLGKTLGFIADFTIEMDMNVLWIATFTTVIAYGVLDGTGSIIDTVNDFMFFKRL